MKQYKVIITTLIDSDDLDEAASTADAICDIMVADNPAITDAHWDELAAAVGYD